MTTDPTTADRPRLAAEEVERRVLAFLYDQLLDPGDTVERDEDLLSDRLDSVAALRLATFVAEEFEIEIQPADYVIENFQTVEAIAGFVQRAGER